MMQEIQLRAMVHEVWKTLFLHLTAQRVGVHALQKRFYYVCIVRWR